MSSGVNLPNFSSQVPSVANASPNQSVENFTTNLLTSLQLLNELDKGGFFKKKESKEDFGKALGTLKLFIDEAEGLAKKIPQELKGLEPKDFEEINMFNPKGRGWELAKKIFLPGDLSEVAKFASPLGSFRVPTDRYLKKKEEERKKEAYKKTPEGRKEKFDKKIEEMEKEVQRANEIMKKKDVVLKLFEESRENPLLFQSLVNREISKLRRQEFLEGKEASKIDVLTLAEMLGVK